jgi:hypothetical protein
MSVWLCLPSAKPDGGTIPLWREKGYKVAVWRDPGASKIDSDFVLEGAYTGYYRTCNHLMRCVFELDSNCNWSVCGADDTLPDPGDPEKIAAQCSHEFAGRTGETGRRRIGGGRLLSASCNRPETRGPMVWSESSTG